MTIFNIVIIVDVDVDGRALAVFGRWSWSRSAGMADEREEPMMAEALGMRED